MMYVPYQMYYKKVQNWYKRNHLRILMPLTIMLDHWSRKDKIYMDIKHII